MSILYPSWIEIPVADIQRAQAFYRAVFRLEDTESYFEEPETHIVVLLPSEKSTHRPGVSLVQSPQHQPCHSGVQVNFHVNTHASLETAIDTALHLGGRLAGSVVVMDDGVHYVTLYDSEGNPIALSSYESPATGS